MSSANQPAENFVWVFNGEGPSIAFPAGVFSRRELAESWIRANGLSGVLTAYPLDKGVYDWAKERGYLTDWTDSQGIPLQRVQGGGSRVVGRFSTGHQAHFHFSDGRLVD
jgi:hypothetical protein